MESQAVLLIDERTINGMMESYAHCQKEKGPHSLFEAKGDGFNLTIYAKQDKSGLRKALFQGERAVKEAAKWGFKAEDERKRKYSFRSQIGSDEVGTGDFFGPICVVAARVTKADLPLLKELGVTDSKKLSDEHILSIGPDLLRFPYSSLSLDDERYNEVHEKGLNMNAIKAKMHNKALFALKQRFPEDEVDIDQFAERGLYYSYLKGEKDVCRIDNFSTKGELAFPSVALASCLARYSFLKKMEALSQRYGAEIPLGASEEVEEFGKRFLERFGEDEMRKAAKLNFATFRKIKGEQ